jgi:hypothetical protein
MLRRIAEGHLSCTGERVHPVRKNFSGLFGREIRECVTQFQPNFRHICHTGLAHTAEEQQARQEPLISHKFRFGALGHLYWSRMERQASAMPLLRQLLA